MFKKVISLVLVIAMAFALVLLTGCGANSSTSQATTVASEATAAPAATTAPTTTAAAPATTVKVKVGLVLIGNIKDGGWSQAHYNGINYMKDQLKLADTDVMYRENIPEEPAACKNAINQLIQAGCNVIFTTSFNYMEPTLAVANENPTVKFFHCSGYKTADNMSNYFGRMYEARYLSGIVAGLKTVKNKIGFVGAVQTPEVISGINAFTLGVQSVNSKAVVEVRWLNNWGEPAKEQELATALLQDGCDVITQHSDSTAPQIAAEAKGAFAIGYDLINTTSAQKAYMTAPVWNWGPYYTEQVKAIQDGTWKSSSYAGGIKEGILDLAPLTAIAPTGAKEKVDAVRAKIIEGSFNVFQGPILGQDGTTKIADKEIWDYNKVMSDMTWFVKGVDGKIDPVK